MRLHGVDLELMLGQLMSVSRMPAADAIDDRGADGHCRDEPQRTDDPVEKPLVVDAEAHIRDGGEEVPENFFAPAETAAATMIERRGNGVGHGWRR